MNPATVLGNSGDPTIPEKTARRNVVIPPNLDQATFTRALDELRTLLPADAVELNDVPLNNGSYYAFPLSHDPYSVLDQEAFASCGAVYPASTEEVSTIIKWANRYKFPLWTISVGRNVSFVVSALMTTIASPL